MKTYLKYLVPLIAIAASVNAYAYSFDCSSYDSKMTYHESRLDGGPASGPNISLVLDGNTLIDITFPGGMNLDTADVQVASQSQWSQTSTSGNYKTTKSVVGITIFSRVTASAAPIFNDLAFCSEVTYIGPPIP